MKGENDMAKAKRLITPEGMDSNNGKEESKNGFLEAVTGMATVKETKQKLDDKIPTLNPPEKIKKLVDEVVKYKKEEKEAKAAKEAKAVDVIDWVKEKQDADGFSQDFKKSYRVSGIKETVTYVSADKFSPVKAEDLEELKAALGTKFDDFITKKVTVTVSGKVMSDAKLANELMELIPKNRIPDFFESVISYQACDGLDQKIYSLPRKVFDRVRLLLKQTSPSLR
jgi:hypothetical protein